MPPAGREKSNSTQEQSHTEPPPPLPERAMQRQAAHRTQPLDSARPDRRVPRELPNLLLRLQRAPHEERSGKQRPAICERRVWGLAGAARQAPTAHTRAWRAPLSVSGNHNPQAWTQQAPQPCAPTSKALTLSSASLIALPESELQKQTNKNKNTRRHRWKENLA